MILHSQTISPDSFDVTNVNASLALNKAVGGSSALFSLYLAMSEARGDPSAQLQAVNHTVEDTEFPARLNHYRRSPLAASTSDINRYLLWQASTAMQGNEHIRLWQAINPDPLSFYNDAKRIAPEVRHNCPYRTQLAWISSAQESVREADPTLLAETIPASQSLTF